MVNPTEWIIDQAMRAIAAGLGAGRLKTVASGVGQIPARGPALIVARHYHHLFDGVALFTALPRRFHIVVTLDWTKTRSTKVFMETLTRVARWPVLLRADALARGREKAAKLFSPSDVARYQRRALRQAAALLVEGELVVVFPEGYPNIDPTFTPKSAPEEFLPFKPGCISILSLAEKQLDHRIPIIPAGLRYTRGTPWIAHVHFGDAIYREPSATKAALLERLERAVKKLSAQTGQPA